MCSNYRPVTRMDRLLTFFGVERDQDDVPPTSSRRVWRLSSALAEARKAEPAGRRRRVRTAAALRDGAAFGRRTYNARTETVRTLPSFREAWRRGQRCIVPAEAIFEPNYESGRAVRWRIGQDGDVPMGIAGIYAVAATRRAASCSRFTMLTVNADTHPAHARSTSPARRSAWS